jgi:FkbM family methyltransferase
MKIVHCPIDCLPSFREVWEDYNVKAVIKGSPRVLDIGANVGAFSLMARELWPTCTVTAYEPNPELFSYLCTNAGDFATCVNAAVTGKEGVFKLVDSGPNRMCGELVEIDDKRDGRLVEVVRAFKLPEADVVKIDIEGGESDVVSSMAYVPSLLMVEYHSEYDRIRIAHALFQKATLMHCYVARPGLGIMHFAKV